MSSSNPTSNDRSIPALGSTSTLDLWSSLNHLSASLSSILVLLESQSEHSEEIHGTHCLLAMVKSQLDQLSAKVCFAD